MMLLLRLIIFTLSFTFIFSNQLEFTNAEINAGETATIELNLDNPDDVIGGFQFQITDLPNHGLFSDIQVTDRTAGFQVQFNEQGDGTVIVVGFDLTLQGVQTGIGPILSLSYESTNIYSSDITISMIEGVSLLSDVVGLAIEYTLTDGLITVNGEAPPDIFAVDNLSATGGFGNIVLFWDDSNVVEIDGYHIFRDGSLVGTATSTTYTDEWLQQGTEYCYEVSAFNEFNESDLSDVVCATTTEIDLEEPPNLTAVENGLEIFLEWDVPPSGIGIGDECVDAYGQAGFLDCYGVCFSENLLGWIGDGLCDGLDAGWGVNFSCLEWECDGCDCAGTGNNSDECIEECGSFQNNNGGSQSADSKEMAEGLIFNGLRDLIGYEVYRDNELIDYTEETEYLDTSDELWYLVESCYNVVSVWDEGTSGFSNTACATPQLNGPSALSAQGTGSFITLGWTSTPDNDQTHFNVYRDDQLLTSIEGISYEDYDTEIGVEYCYFVKAFYEGIGESPASNTSCTTWDVYPPSNIEAVAGDQFIDLTWEEPVGGEEVSLQYDDGVLANAFYFFGTYEDGLAHGTRFDVGVDFDVLAASLKILSEGDEYWPWPNGTHGPVRVLIFDDNGGAPGNLLYEEEAIAEDGWATVYPNLTGLSGSFYVIATHDATFADPEGFGVDGGVDYPDNMYTYYYGVWNTGDYLGYGGDYMIASQVFAYGDIQTLSYSSQTPSTFSGDKSLIVSSIPDEALHVQNNHESHPDYQTTSRDLQSFDIYRDNNLIANVGADVYSYRDEPLDNMTEYCYTLGSNYDEGTSELSDLVCATPYPGPAASDLIAVDLGGTIGLDWISAPVDPLFGDILIDYQVYRDGENIGSSTTNSYIDGSEIIAGIEYCYEVKANYPSGETFPTNLACAVYVLDPPMTVLTEGNNAAHGINITWNSPGTEGTGENIESPKFVTGVPFEDFGTTVGFADDYDEECPYTGSLSPDVVYQWAASPGDYHLDICDSDYDTKIYIYDENLNNVACVDDSCNDPAGQPYRSDIFLNIATAGLYYVVIDGYGSQSGNYHFILEEGVFTSQDDTPQPEKTEHNLELYSNDNYNLEIMSRDLLAYRVYRDDVLLVEVDTDTFEYFDATAEHDVVYCYVVKAVYDDGESVPSNASCNQWILPPATEFDVAGTNGQVELLWIASNSAEVEGYSVYKDGTFLASTTEIFYNDTEAIHNTEYCYYVVANYGDLGDSQPSDEECGMWEILSPDEVFAVGDDGVVHVTWTDPPAGGSGGIGGECELFDYYGNEIVGFLDCIEQCIDPLYLVWLGDGLCDDGSWGVYFNCDEFNWDEGDCPEYVNEDDDSEYNYRTAEQLGDLPPFVPAQDRDLVAFNIYRDGDYLATVDAGIYAYDDFDVVNLTEYCYTVTSVYEVGESAIEDDPVCATPIPGVAPNSLYAYGEAGAITLEWVGGSNQVIDYNIYRDGALFDTSMGASYIDITAEHDVEYCYIVSANYPSGESQPTNESCGMWVLAPPLSITATGGNGFVQVDWTEPGVSTCSDEVIPSLPFNAIGSNAGMGDDWLVQGSQGADYAYFLNIASPMVIDITLCSANTTYDTKLEIFTADQDCNETTTGNYIDDATCEFSSLQSSLWGVSLQPGQYYIVVDGYSGQEGTYEINVTQSFQQANPPNDLLTNIALESEKAGYPINEEDWNIADESNVSSRDLNGFELYRDNNLIATVDADTYSYIDQPLENGTEYCYYVIAVYDEGDSQPTPIVCAAPDAGPMCPPENLVLNIQDGDTDIDLSWDFPNPDCVGDGEYTVECGGGSWENEVSWDLVYGGTVIASGLVGSYELELDSGDYTLNMYDSFGDGWNGNSWNLYSDGTLVASCTLDSGTEGWCDFSLTGVASNDEVEPVETVDNAPIDKEEDTSQDTDDNHDENINESSRIEGFNIYRDDQLLAWVPSEENTYTDSDIVFGQEYCYKVKAVYEEGESNPTEVECGSVIDPEDFSVVDFSSPTVESGGQVAVDVNADNQFPVAGFQFWIADSPNLLETISITTTDRSEGFSVDYNEQPDGSVIIVGFNLTGGVIEIGSGPILEITYQASAVTEEQIVSLDIVEFFLGDSMGVQIPAFSESGTVTIVPAGASVLTVSDVVLSEGEEGVVEISLENEIAIAGFQFNLVDTPDLLSFIEVSGTERTEAFSIQANEINNEIITLGFSFTGDVIAPGTGPIVTITYQATSQGTSTLNLTDIVLSDATSTTVPATSDSGTATVTEQQVYGCTDMGACNYNPEATTDDGNCDFESCAGCTDPDAPNYDQDATIDDGSCSYEVSQSLTFDAYAFNSFSFNVDVDGESIGNIFSDSDILLVTNDNSEYFVPNYDVDQIETVYYSEGYKVFLNGAVSQGIQVSGLPVDLSSQVQLNAFMFNLLPYYPQECMATSDVFAGYEDQILIAKNDASDYFVPAFGVETMSEMCPGESYSIFLNGSDDISFTYPMGVASYTTDMIDDYKLRTRTNSVTQTGLSHLVLVTDISGHVEEGDQLRAYANNVLVGEINIVEEHLNGYPIDLIAVGGADLSEWGGPVLQGYETGDAIELRLYSSLRDVELRVAGYIDNNLFGNDAEISIGSAVVLNESAIATSFELTQNYPNPFNPSTTINYNINTAGHVSLKVYDVMGRLVRTLVNEYKEAGNTNGYSVTWNGLDNLGNQVSSGIYIYSLQSQGVNSSKKMLLMK